ncbi:HNH nuclease [Rhodoferax ferrireducens T118]|uniref:HNH nuclease n=1 Tax=Albidiferax ferrireducens (strain ATCC BAA-621 / DSM 15236 / T118) TaxID=338969 RepID=Q21Z60_ALBFT|nr:HNH endonuclease [Rhodoferax ferrireducens]ABD68943.1 HNH nuclease [Rhodoferax ferrireducens T118]
MLHQLPSAEGQLLFLSKLQRLFSESDFTATYKFALLIALADLAVELGADDGGELALSTRQIGERFIQIYWRQALPYGTGLVNATPGILIQNNGTQAAVISAIAAFRMKHGVGTPQLARALPEYQALLGSVAQTVSAQPLNYLQNFGGMTDVFLFERAGLGKVKLKPGVMYCLRRFQPLVQQLARSHWVNHIKSNRRNISILGQADDLEDFLFAASRQSLLAMASGLRKLDGEKCFYCGTILTNADVDHFVPFSQYPRDLAHNFVLAHPACNRSKSDTLAAGPLLERWLDRLGHHADSLTEIGQAAGMIADVQVSRQIAAWGYTSALTQGGHAWLAPSKYEPIDQSYSGYFTA